MARTLGERLASRARESFLGRAREMAILLQTLEEDGPLVVHVHGIAGIGKSTLLQAFSREARQRGSSVFSLDCRAIEPTERGFLTALGPLVGSGPDAASDLDRFAEALPVRGPPSIFVLDAYEVFRLMDTWLRRECLPGLPDSVRFVLASRQPPTPAWVTAPEWHGLFRSVSLGPLRPPDALRLLALADVPPEEARRIQAFARGHPLALRLAARAVTEKPDSDLAQLAIPRVVAELARLYLGEVGDPATRSALEAACAIRRVTRSLLRAVDSSLPADVAFERLRSLPFVEAREDGLVIHDAVRESIASALRSADRDRYRRIRRAAWRELRAELRGAEPDELWAYTADMLYLLENPVIREAFFPNDVQRFSVEPATEDDGGTIAEIVALHEGYEGARTVEHWWERLPSAFHVVREGDGSVAGFYLLLDRSDLTPAAMDRDPVVRGWSRHLTAHPIAGSESALFVRRWLSRDHGESPSPVQAACWLDLKRSYLERRPRLRRVYIAAIDLAAFAEAATRLRFEPIPERDVVMDGETYHAAMLDMGAASVDGWLADLVSAELGVEEEGILDPGAREIVLGGRRTRLTELEFDLLRYLSQNEGRAVSRDELLERIWGTAHGGASNVVDVVVSGLRRKLAEHAPALETVRGVGYRYRGVGARGSAPS